jgi:Fe-S-cluster-containing hydrogenase component 2
MASLSPYALDMGVASIIGAREDAIPSIAVAKRRRLGPRGVKDVGFVGEDPSNCRIKDFNLPHGGELPPIVAAIVGRALWIRPRMNRSKCTSCGDCMRNCPVEAIEMQGDYPLIDYKRCISCFCCQEMCPSGAVMSQESRASRMMRR